MVYQVETCGYIRYLLFDFNYRQETGKVVRDMRAVSGDGMVQTNQMVNAKIYVEQRIELQRVNSAEQV